MHKFSEVNYSQEKVNKLLQQLFKHIKVKPVKGCWEWQCFLDKDGYGSWTIYRNGFKPKKFRIHRLLYEILKAPIPDGLVTHHKCENPRCCFPDHIEPTTTRINTIVYSSKGNAAINARKTHCPKGHPLSGNNLHVKPNRQRVCLICRLESKRRVNKRLKAERHVRREARLAAMPPKTHCKRGHELIESNIYTRPNGARCCRTCRRLEYENSQKLKRIANKKIV